MQKIVLITGFYHLIQKQKPKKMQLKQGKYNPKKSPKKIYSKIKANINIYKTNKYILIGDKSVKLL